MNRRKLNWIDWTLYGASFALIVYSVIELRAIGNDGTTETGKGYYYLARLCQELAEKIGRAGIAAERQYYSIIERERMN